ncbi:unnamed protein product, partial [Brassica oleracea]
WAILVIGSKQPRVVSVASLLPARRRVSPSPWVFFILVDSVLARGGD